MRVSNRQIADAFRNAQVRLWDGVSYRTSYYTNSDPDTRSKEKFICNAISSAYRATEEVRDVACGIVMERLEGHGTLGEWLDSRGIRDTATPAYCRNLQAHRLAWLKMLEAEFRSKK